MEQSIKKTLLGHTRDGRPVWSFRIPNNTRDCLEVTNYGCSVRGLYVHDGQGEGKDLVRGMASLEDYEASGQTWAGLLDGPVALAGPLGRKVWEVADQGGNYVLFSCLCAAGESGLSCDVKVGVRITWVDLDRMVVDYFLTPQGDVALGLGARLLLGGRGEDHQVRSFCPQAALPGQAACPVEETPYGDQQFRPVEGALFRNGSEEIKPLAELWAPGTGMTLSAYGTFPVFQAQAAPDGEGILLRQRMEAPVALRGGETLAGRAIYGIDWPRPQEAQAGPQAFPFFGI